MLSDRRLHPLAIVLRVIARMRRTAVPSLLAVVGAERLGVSLPVALGVLLVGHVALAFAHYLVFRYRFEARELVIRSGVLFRSERHVPYARIQNLDAVQNLVHRMFGIFEVRVQTGSGSEPEAVLEAVSADQREVMRRCVFGDVRARDARAGDARAGDARAGDSRAGDTRADDTRADDTRAGDAPPEAEASPAVRHVLIELSPREVIATGLVEHRGLALMAAAFGVLWQSGLADKLLERLTGYEDLGERAVRELVSWAGAGGHEPTRIAVTIVVLFLVVVTLSVSWAVVRLHGFTLVKSGDDLHAQHGLFTRVVAAIPQRRIQTLTLREGPLHRAVRRITVEAATAGGGDDATRDARCRLAPLIAPAAVPALLAEVAPDMRPGQLVWQPLDERAERRVRVRALVASAAVAAICVPLVGWWTAAIAIGLVAWTIVYARQYVRHARWALDDNIVAFRRGWLWRRTTIARLAKLQVVTLEESPFDRRYAMASVGIDTAGASVKIGLLPRDTAVTLQRSLAHAASRTDFRW
jgi:putative membrane protein